MKTSPARRSSPSPRSRRQRRPPLLLAVTLGLVAGLALSGPLSSLLGIPAAGGIATGVNPFAGWIGWGEEDVLLLGTDVSGGNTDVIAAIRIGGGRTQVIQIPRDTYIEAERYGPVKINALFALGGPEAIKREVSHRLGRPIRHHLVVNLSSLRKMADQLGGIEVDVPKRMYYVDNSQGLTIDLEPGPQNLRGRDLEGFLRFRHDEAGDIGRLERQQLALKALFRKLTRPDNLVRLPALLLANSDDLRTDMGPMELGGLVTAMGTTRLETRRLEGRPFMQDGISYWDADWPSAAAAVPAEEERGGGLFRF